VLRDPADHHAARLAEGHRRPGPRGAGVGGGSLVYANTLYRPLDAFYDDPQWRDIADWRKELAPHYDTAERMLGVVRYNRMTPMDDAMQKVAVRMGVGDTFHQTPVGVFLGKPGVRVPDPYFDGQGPERSGCLHCGSCMTGCRHGAKNTLVKNYLYLAEKLGTKVFPRTEVRHVRPAQSGYVVKAKGGKVFECDQVVFAAGTLGTQQLLHRMKAAGSLPRLSGRLGALTRTNSEALLGATVLPGQARKRKLDYTQGVAITSSFHPDSRTHIEPVRYGRGSNSMGVLQSALTDGGPGRFGRWLKRCSNRRSATCARFPYDAGPSGPSSRS
jgi:cholesterol oxidase